MLISLKIKNIALIDECTITLGKGLNILSGETGAGKSIIIDALSFVLGCRADKSLIRHGESFATVEAVFETEDKEILRLMEEVGLIPENTLIIKRTMTESRNDVRVNGESFTLSMLKKLTSALIDILGQHEHQSLLKVAYHIELLDKFAGDKIAKLKDKTSKLYAEYRDIYKKIEKLGDTSERERKLDILKYQIEEIERAELIKDEEETLLTEREKYRNSEKIVSAVSNSYNSIESELSVHSMLSSALSHLIQVTAYDEELEQLAERLDSTKIEIDDIAESLKSYVEGYDYDERQANYIEQRVDTINLLKRKYGGSISSVLGQLESMSEEYDELINADEELSKLENQLQDVVVSLYNTASKLSKERRAAAREFECKIVSELKDLAIKDVTFCVNFSDMPDIDNLKGAVTANGFDSVEFLISPNMGEPLRPLAKIVSGGEMSRIMLSLENIISGLDGIQTLVFDEIDTGISGNVAHTVAKKLSNISRTKQVIAVTHLPQLASYADSHHLITKSVKGDKTLTDVTLLEGESKVEEIVRLSGGAGSQINIMHARELLENALLEKESNRL